MPLGAHAVYRSANRLKNRRYDALNKATVAGHVDVANYLIRQGPSYGFDELPRKDSANVVNYKLLNVAYPKSDEVAEYLITKHGADALVEQWLKQFLDTVYRRVDSMAVHQ